MARAATATPAMTTPAIGDIDDDGLPEIVAATGTRQLITFEHDGAVAWQSNVTWNAIMMEDVEDRWIQARRIWNQHTYHVTNVREDGMIPQFEQPRWEKLNTFHTYA